MNMTFAASGVLSSNGEVVSDVIGSVCVVLFSVLMIKYYD
jgi:hypothetical protein